MPKYLIIDPIVFGGIWGSNYNSETDLILKSAIGRESPPYCYLQNGKAIVNKITSLVKDHKYQLIFCSRLNEQYQKEIYQNLYNAVEKSRKGEERSFPTVYVMTVYDSSAYSHCGFENPLRYTTSLMSGHTSNVDVVGYGVTNENDAILSDTRIALSKIVNLVDRYNHIVIASRSQPADAARQEGYVSFNVSDDFALDRALQKVITIEDLLYDSDIEDKDSDERFLLLGSQQSQKYAASGIDVKVEGSIGAIPPPHAVVSSSGLFSGKSGKETKTIHGEIPTELVELTNLRNSLDKEINSWWPYPYKSRKKTKRDFLDKVIDVYENLDGAASLATCIKRVKEMPKYHNPLIGLYLFRDVVMVGSISTRTSDLITRILAKADQPEDKKDQVNERSPLLQRNRGDQK